MIMAYQWELLIRPPLKAWAMVLVTALELPNEPNCELVVSEYLLLALFLGIEEENETLSEDYS